MHWPLHRSGYVSVCITSSVFWFFYLICIILFILFYLYSYSCLVVIWSISSTQEIRVKVVSVCIHHAHPATPDELHYFIHIVFIYILHIIFLYPYFIFIWYISTQEIQVKVVSVCIHHAHPATLDEHAIEVEESSLALDHCIVTGTVFWAMQKKQSKTCD